MRSIDSQRIAAGLTLLLVGGCTHDKVVGRYATATCVGEDGVSGPCHDVMPVAEVSVVTIATPAATATPAMNSASPSPGAAGAPATGSGSPSAAAPILAAAMGTALPDRALAACVTALYAAAAKPAAAAGKPAPEAETPASPADTLCKSLAPAVKPDTSGGVEDRTVFHRTMIVTVAKDAMPFNPADRLEATDVLIEPDNAVITTWDAATTTYSMINAGTVALTQAQNATGSVMAGGPPTAPVQGGLAGSFSQSESRAETFAGTEQLETLTVSLSNNDAAKLDKQEGDHRNRMRIHRQGGIGIDLTGNTVVKMDLVLPEQVLEQTGSEPEIPIETRPIFTVSGSYRNGKGDWTPAAMLMFKPQQVKRANIPAPITATVTLTYTLRHVVAGDATLEERDDKVVERTVTAPKLHVTLVPAGQVGPRSFGIVSQARGSVPVQVKLAPIISIPPSLCFDSSEAAEDLVTYLRNAKSKTPEKLGTAEMGFNDGGWQPLSTKDLEGLQVRSDVCISSRKPDPTTPGSSRPVASNRG